MLENEFVSGTAKAILEKYADPIIKGITDFGKGEWEKFKIDFDISFINYLEKSFEKYSKVKTILYRTEPKYIYDFFVCPNLRKGNFEIVDGTSIDNILCISNFIIIQGTGGIGKSTFLKHLFVNELSKKQFIPVFIELKDLNAINGDYDICDFVFQRLYDLGSTLKKEYMDYALSSGCFTFLLDGYDEIFATQKDIFFRKFSGFCDRYSKNSFVIASRPYSEFVEFQRFTVLTLENLNKEQAMQLVKNVEFDNDIKSNFLKALDERLYKKYRSFASNPLLLSIMLLTYDNYAEIPEKLHLFYANAFETLYSKHDATKAGYRREMRCTLSQDDFKKGFSYFCFMTYYQGKVEFTDDEVRTILKRVKPNLPSLEAEDFLFDLVNSVCLLYKDGLNYKFAHRSFQEYFTAVFLKELSDQGMKKFGTRLARNDFARSMQDSVFTMLRDMSTQRFEQNILLPLLIETEDSCVGDKYDFYYKVLSPKISFRLRPGKKQVGLYLAVPYLINKTNIKVMEYQRAHFLFFMSKYYTREFSNKVDKLNFADNELFDYLATNKGYEVNQQIECEKYKEDHKFYDIIKRTWIGFRIDVLANLRDYLEQKMANEETDLDMLLSD